jgi:hypothetical protein
VSRPRAFVDYQTSQVLNLLDQIDQTSRAAAATDEAGEWGVDGWIRLFHNLFDTQIRLLASMTEAAISGPWWLRREPDNLDVITADHARPYARRLAVAEKFHRLGRDSVTIPAKDIDFDPAILPAGEVEFEIKVPDEYAGFNYKGRISLTEYSTDPDRATEYQTVTVGL